MVIYVYVYICIYVFMYIYVYMYMYIYIYTQAVFDLNINAIWFNMVVSAQSNINAIRCKGLGFRV